MIVLRRRPGQELVTDDHNHSQPNPQVRVRDTETGTLSRPVSLQSAILRGYWEGAGDNDDPSPAADKAAPVVLVKEARCPQCRRWVGRNIPVGSECYCPEHKAVRIAG